MEKIKLTKTVVEKLPYAVKGKQVDYYDSDLDGFGIRVSHTGKKYFVRRLIGAKRVRVMIGSHPIKAAEDARSDAKIKLGLMESGTDPNEQVRVQNRIRESEAQRITVAELVKEYVDRHAKTFKRSWEEDERLLHKELLNEEKELLEEENDKGSYVWNKRKEKDATDWSKRKAADITKRDVTLLLESIIDRGTPAMSNQVLKIVRKMFNFAVERDILQHTPCNGVKALAPNTRRERTLNESEIETFWRNLSLAGISDDIEQALKLVLITAQRPGEVSGMHTSEINGHWWTIPSERTKNGKEHRVYLANTALDIITKAIEDIQQSLIKHNLRMVKEKKPELPITKPYVGYIFPCPHRNKDQPIDSHALPVAVRRNLAWPLIDSKGEQLFQEDGRPSTENKIDIEKFTPHDLRRTAATFMSQLGIMDEIIDAVLNHAKQGIIRTYNLNRYDKEKQMALESWERKLISIISNKSSNVIPIIRKAS
jgi:integrase